MSPAARSCLLSAAAASLPMHAAPPVRHPQGVADLEEHGVVGAAHDRAEASLVGREGAQGLRQDEEIGGVQDGGVGTSYWNARISRSSASSLIGVNAGRMRRQAW